MKVKMFFGNNISELEKQIAEHLKMATQVFGMSQSTVPNPNNQDQNIWITVIYQ